MLRLPAFEYHRPTTLAAAVRLLDELPDACIVGGGTDLFPNMKRGLTAPKQLIALGHLSELSYIRCLDDGTMCIGAGTRLDTVAEDARAPEALRKAVRSIAMPQVRSMGTLGGNICLDTRCSYYNQSAFWRQALGGCMKTDRSQVCRVAPGSDSCLATYSADAVPVLIALRAQVSLIGPRGAREMDLSDLYQNDGIGFLHKGRDEILTEVRIPPVSGWRISYWKLRDREAFDFPTAGVAVAVTLDAEDRIQDARVVTTGIFSAPLRLQPVEQALIGQRLDAETVAKAADAGYQEARPVDNTSGSIPQRRTAVRAFIRRALTELAPAA